MTMFRSESVLPGVLLCLSVAGAALALQELETVMFGRAWLEALVLAIIIGTLMRTLWQPGAHFQTGILFSAKTLLEIAVVLLGASVSLRAVLAAGPALLGMIACVVLVAIAGSYAAGRLLGLPHRLATLIACGNSICGNSAIAAVAPLIGADGDDVAASIAFTAVLGVGVVLALPFSASLLHLSGLQYGAFAGLTVYAVPQVLAATASAGPLAVQFGTLVKLVRVLMLGPVVLLLSVISPREDPASRHLARLVPWFIPGFLALAAARGAGFLPQAACPPIADMAALLTIVSMAALGLTTNLRSVTQAGLRVTAVVSLSLAFLAAISLGLIRFSGLV